MSFLITDAGGPGVDLARKAIEHFQEVATQAGIDFTGFNPDAPLHEQIKWAEERGLTIGTTYVRSSSKIQHSSKDQLRQNIYATVRSGIFVPPQFICLDEAKKGHGRRRVGLARLNDILGEGLTLVLVLFNLSRLYRNRCKSHEFIAERVVEKGHRVVVLKDGIDTSDEKTCNAQVQ
jgi:hypothetical protein